MTERTGMYTKEQVGSRIELMQSFHIVTESNTFSTDHNYSRAMEKHSRYNPLFVDK